MFPASLGLPEILVDGGLLEGEAAAGRRLGESLRGLAGDGRVVLLFYDSVAATAPPRLHPASP